MSACILVVDDDAPLREVVRYALAREGHRVLEAADGAQALAVCADQAVDLVVLDVSMPGLDGLETCRRLRATATTPIVFLSSRDDELDRVLGLELGGDDYLTKPFSTRELASRVKAVLRRTREAPPASDDDVLHAGPVRLDPVGFRAWVGKDELTLTPTEFRLLLAFVRQPGRLWTREDLMARAYPDGRHVAQRTLDSHLRGVRAALREAGADAIETVHGLGYRMRRG